MHDWSQGKKLRYLMERGSSHMPGVTLSPWQVAKGVERLGGKITWRFLYDVLNDTKRITSFEKLELLATFFGVPVNFWSEDPDQWLPPIPLESLRMAVMTSKEVSSEGHELLADLYSRAKQLAKEHREGRKNPKRK